MTGTFGQMENLARPVRFSIDTQYIEGTVRMAVSAVMFASVVLIAVAGR